MTNTNRKPGRALAPLLALLLTPLAGPLLGACNTVPSIHGADLPRTDLRGGLEGTWVYNDEEAAAARIVVRREGRDYRMFWPGGTEDAELFATLRLLSAGDRVIAELRGAKEQLGPLGEFGLAAPTHSFVLLNGHPADGDVEQVTAQILDYEGWFRTRVETRNGFIVASPEALAEQLRNSVGDLKAAYSPETQSGGKPMFKLARISRNHDQATVKSLLEACRAEKARSEAKRSGAPAPGAATAPAPIQWRGRPLIDPSAVNVTHANINALYEDFKTSNPIRKDAADALWSKLNKAWYPVGDLSWTATVHSITRSHVYLYSEPGIQRKVLGEGSEVRLVNSEQGPTYGLVARPREGFAVPKGDTVSLLPIPVADIDPEIAMNLNPDTTVKIRVPGARLRVRRVPEVHLGKESTAGRFLILGQVRIVR